MSIEIKRLTGVFINHYHDTVLGLTYGKILTSESLESVRFPTLLENYKYKHLVETNHIVEVELVKTRKNWIVKEIVNSSVYYTPCDFKDYLNMCEVVKLTRESIIEEQRTDFLVHFINFLQAKERIDILEFKDLLQRNMGFL